MALPLLWAVQQLCSALLVLSHLLPPKSKAGRLAHLWDSFFFQKQPSKDITPLSAIPGNQAAVSKPICFMCCFLFFSHSPLFCLLRLNCGDSQGQIRTFLPGEIKEGLLEAWLSLFQLKKKIKPPSTDVHALYYGRGFKANFWSCSQHLSLPLIFYLEGSKCQMLVCGLWQKNQLGRHTCFPESLILSYPLSIILYFKMEIILVSGSALLGVGNGCRICSWSEPPHKISPIYYFSPFPTAIFLFPPFPLRICMICFGSTWDNFLLSLQLCPTVTQMSHSNGTVRLGLSRRNQNLQLWCWTRLVAQNTHYDNYASG